jgi:serine/threonine protein phosphatase PrpC
VIPVPEIKRVRISDATPFIIIGCDGIWDCIKSQNCVEFFFEKVKKNTGPYSVVVAELMD